MEDYSTKSKKTKNNKLFIIILVLSILVFSLAGYIYKNNYDSKNFNFNVSVADQYFDEEEYSAAKEYYQRALKYKRDILINSKIEDCNKFGDSLVSFENGIKLFNEKNYSDAYVSFSKVILEDEEKYKLAQEKMLESSSLYFSQEAASAEELADKFDYQGAFDHINKILNIDPNNQNALGLKAQYQHEAEEFAKQKEIDNARSILRISSCYTARPNSAGGVDLHIVWTNNSGKTIKYITSVA